MVNMTDIFGNALSIAGSFMDSDLVNRFMMVIFAVILVFGVLNCILGYRLLRFWMMLGGFLVGGGLALVVVHTMGIQEKSTMLIAALAAGVVFAVIAFLTIRQVCLSWQQVSAGRPVFISCILPAPQYFLHVF